MESVAAASDAGDRPSADRHRAGGVVEARLSVNVIPADHGEGTRSFHSDAAINTCGPNVNVEGIINSDPSIDFRGGARRDPSPQCGGVDVNFAAILNDDAAIDSTCLKLEVTSAGDLDAAVDRDANENAHSVHHESTVYT